jgi:hypothetical protein
MPLASLRTRFVYDVRQASTGLMMAKAGIEPMKQNAYSFVYGWTQPKTCIIVHAAAAGRRKRLSKTAA